VTPAILVVPAAVLVVGGWVRWRHLVVTVDGDSMSPAYRDGERLLVRRRRLGGVRRGMPVLVRLPPPEGGAVGEVLMVKRAAALPGDPLPAGVPGRERVVPPARLVVLGDNPNGSHDSRAVGWVRAGALVGVVVRRLG
jgi:signal peptidase I